MSEAIQRPSFAERHAATLRQLRFYAWSFGRSPSSLLGLAIVLGFFALAAFGPLIVPYPQDATGAMNLGNRLKPPSPRTGSAPMRWATTSIRVSCWRRARRSGSG